MSPVVWDWNQRYHYELMGFLKADNMRERPRQKERQREREREREKDYMHTS